MQHDWGLRGGWSILQLHFLFSNFPPSAPKTKCPDIDTDITDMLCAVLGGDRCMTLDIIEVLLWKKNPTTLLIKVVPTT